MIEVKSPGQGLQPNRKNDLIGTRARRHIGKGSVFYPSDLEMLEAKARHFNFKRSWGVPVRYHDYRDVSGKTNGDLLEFHLSYKDLDVNLETVFDHSIDADLVVHSPELFRTTMSWTSAPPTKATECGP